MKTNTFASNLYTIESLVSNESQNISKQSNLTLPGLGKYEQSSKDEYKSLLIPEPICSNEQIINDSNGNNDDRTISRVCTNEIQTQCIKNEFPFKQSEIKINLNFHPKSLYLGITDVLQNSSEINTIKYSDHKIHVRHSQNNPFFNHLPSEMTFLNTEDKPLDLTMKSCLEMNTQTKKSFVYDSNEICSLSNSGRDQKLESLQAAINQTKSDSKILNKTKNNANNGRINKTNLNDNKTTRRAYTEAELSAAVRAICFGRLGTRRAASVYGIPRSTLRNKICKLNELKKREEERLGGKPIVMSEFLLNLIQQTKFERNFVNVHELSSENSQIEYSFKFNKIEPSLENILCPNFQSFNQNRILSKSNEYSIHNANRVASILQVNCRKNHLTRNADTPKNQIHSINSILNSNTKCLNLQKVKKSSTSSLNNKLKRKITKRLSSNSEHSGTIHLSDNEKYFRNSQLTNLIENLFNIPIGDNLNKNLNITDQQNFKNHSIQIENENFLDNCLTTIHEQNEFLHSNDKIFHSLS